MSEAGRLYPWEVFPSLSKSHLVRVGQIIWDARVSAAEDAKWDLGDSLWSIGTVAYGRTCRACEEASIDNIWLSTSSNRNGEFVLTINGIPIRFFRVRPGREFARKYTVPSGLERICIQEVLELHDAPQLTEAYCRILVTTDDLGFPLEVTFAQIDSSGGIQNPWPIPVRKTDPSVHSLDDLRVSGVEMPPPPVGDELEEREDDLDATGEEA